MFQIIQATTDADYQAAAALFREYANSLDFTLSFQSFENELTILPQMYGPPRGALFLAQNAGEFVGAAGLRQIENANTCEVKRMYIRPDFQGKGIGKALLLTLIEKATLLNYKLVKLDTLGPKMPAAVALYKSFGFEETKPYNYNPHEGAVYFEKDL
ncbi:GNAT family N-acetyltransferase [Dyadobacter arcticus]|uniref:GNAT superfamily N-acetyltransferase n=1 Tax=Dyadobacter arcticus TaxID=1078754 RepID=A0ABX0UK99_9BACT|nr:GNAT family N-acetyltransferase [Dyadobacter arcticus]NIJ51830.1 GNAT superfamily N-acetyltransferase [Dyadobacter arcticus]